MRNRNSEDQNYTGGADQSMAAGHLWLLSTLEQLLAIEGTTVRSAAMDRAADLIVEAIGAEKCDAFCTTLQSRPWSR